MRRFDKKYNMQKVNLLAEQRYLQSKNVIGESLIIENFINSYKLLLELKFHDSPDEDLPGGKRTIIFNKEDEYPSPEGNTHGLLSHAIKHYLEFEPERVKGLLDKVANEIRQEADELYMVDKNGNVVLDGDRAKKEINHNVILNTLDSIQDKVKNGKNLLDIEKRIHKYTEEMAKQYQELIKQKMNSAVDIDTDQEVADDAISNNKNLKFKGSYSGKDFDYYLDPKDSSLVASDGDSVSTLFRIDKKGNRLDKMSGYFSRGTKIYNDKLRSALNLSE
jgi:hypothetical protein|tara:strand:- start:2838 stop:3668 length:831 start_codon:yes stop_codon:yes gene_type:complete